MGILFFYFIQVKKLCYSFFSTLYKEISDSLSDMLSYYLTLSNYLFYFRSYILDIEQLEFLLLMLKLFLSLFYGKSFIFVSFCFKSSSFLGILFETA